MPLDSIVGKLERCVVNEIVFGFSHTFGSFAALGRH